VIQVQGFHCAFCLTHMANGKLPLATVSSAAFEAMP
jgi:hypothetical protein